MYIFILSFKITLFIYHRRVVIINYKIKKHSYLHYETKELTRFVNEESERGYKFIKMFSGFFVFERSDCHHKYFVVFRKNVDSQEVYQDLDRYLVVSKKQTISNLDTKKIYEIRKQIIVNCLLKIVIGAITLILEMRALRNPIFHIHINNKLLLLVSFLYYINYVIFALAEIIDYSINRNNKASENYKRSKLKKQMFQIGNILEVYSSVADIFIWGYLFFSGEILITVAFIILYLIELIIRYHTLTEFFGYLFSFELYAAICFLLQVCYKK